MALLSGGVRARTLVGPILQRTTPSTLCRRVARILACHRGIGCLDVGACLKVNTRALGRGALHKKVDSIPLLLTSEEIGFL